MRRRAQTRYELGAALLQEGNQPGALQALFQSVEADPDHVDSHYLLGAVFLLRGDLERAEQHLLTCLRLRPRFPEAQNTLGVVYIHQGRHDDAIRILKKATADILYHEPHVALGNLGWAYLEKGDTAQAVRALKRAVFLEPRFCVGHYRLGNAHFRRHEYELAARSLQAAVDVDDEACHRLQDAFRLLGLSRMHLRDRESALADFGRCRDIDPETQEGRECQSYVQSLQ
jgi:Tfp pilus assembly protein PilF